MKRIPELEKAIRDAAPCDLGVVAIERIESTTGFRVYYSAEPSGEWFTFKLEYESAQLGRIPEWNDIVHIEGDLARAWIDKQNAIYEFLDIWASGFGGDTYRDFYRHLSEGLGIPKDAGIFILSPQQCADRPEIARKFIQDHLLHSSIEG